MVADEVLVIAEVGVNHNGSVDMAMDLVEAAWSSGANVVKFQTFKPELLVTRAAPKARYQRLRSLDRAGQFQMLADLALSEDAFRRIAEHCVELGIEFMSTAFDDQSLDFLLDLGVEHLKIPSGEIDNLPFMRRVGKCGLPIFMSTGMATLAEVEQALLILEAAGTSRHQVTVMQCTTSYPTPPEEVNLRAMVTMGRHLGVEVGLSDHSLGVAASIAATALGATVIEKHITLDRHDQGPDHAASLEPGEFKVLVDSIRFVLSALGSGKKEPQPSELENRTIVRRSLVAKSPIQEGETLSLENMTAKRPGGGLSPMMWDQMLGRTATRKYEVDDFLEGEG